MSDSRIISPLVTGRLRVAPRPLPCLELDIVGNDRKLLRTAVLNVVRGLRKAGANLTPVERDAVNRLIARDLLGSMVMETLMARLTGLEEDIAKTKAENNELKARINTLEAGTSGGSSTVDTKLLSKPSEFEGKEEDWTRFSLKVKAYLGAIDPRYNELLKIAEDPDQSLNHVDLGPGDDRRDGQLFFVLTMLLKDRAMDKVELVDANCGLQLWRKLTQEYEPKWKSRHLSRHQAILSFRFPDDVIAGFDQFEKELRHYHAITGKHIDEDTKSGVILGALAKSSNEKHRDLANHHVLNSYRLDSYNKMFVEVREILGTKKYMNQESVITLCRRRRVKEKVARARKVERATPRARSRSSLRGECWVCGRAGHKQSECWYNPNPKSKAKAAAKSNTVDKSVKCEHCGIKGHKRSECRKLKAEQLAMARSTPSSSTSAADGELTAKKRKRDIAALEKQLAELKLEELSSLESVVETVELSAVECEPHVEIGAVTTNSKLISVGIDSGAEITVWPPELAPETPTEESDESRVGVKYFGPGDKNGPTLVNHGRRRYVVKVGGLERILKAHVVPVRKPLLAVCDLLATGHDVHFTAKTSSDAVGSLKLMLRCSPRTCRETGWGELCCRPVKALRMLSPKGSRYDSIRLQPERWCSSVVGARNADRGRESSTRSRSLSVSSLVQIMRSRQRKGRCTLSSRVGGGRCCICCH